MNNPRVLLAIVLSCVMLSAVAYGQQAQGLKKSGDHVLIVPKGTRIQTDISHSSDGAPATPYQFEGKVEIPVRLGFTTAIPASAKITVYVTSITSEGAYQELTYQEFVELLDVTVDGKVYDIRTDRISMQAATAKEVTFTLLEPLELHR